MDSAPTHAPSTTFVVDSVINKCIDALKTERARKKLKELFSPLTEIVVQSFCVYIYAIVILGVLGFCMLSTILVLLLHMLYRMPTVIPSFHSIQPLLVSHAPPTPTPTSTSAPLL